MFRDFFWQTLTTILMGIFISSPCLAMKKQWSFSKKDCPFLLTINNVHEFTEEHVLDRIILIESFWQKTFAERGWPFEEIRIEFYNKSIQSPDGPINSLMGFVYVNTNRTIYISKDFEKVFRNRLGPLSDVSLTALLAHEVGHHIQTITGARTRLSQLVVASKQYSRQSEIIKAFLLPFEKQADCLLGVFFNYLWKEKRITQNEINYMGPQMMTWGADMQAIQALLKGITLDQNETHPSGSERIFWFNKGLASGNLLDCETYSVPVLEPR